MSTTTVNISFQESLLSDIDKVARKESRTRSELLREAARMYIERKRRWDRIFDYAKSKVVENRLTEGDIEREIAAYRKKRRRKS
ncbi:MAG: ribbon-helix-helix protein, CopG family [Deltaproteobacteria bacterium]|nr:ribbon-helix-helix protein, CopG family [Deltaproteobacteria bacterium]MBW1736141.1 ribbon-helix-helix protein, CopG family [Deltaproteobacteria bacterium]MBW1908469.1 ribbon-helix-helix protein, CopG family [Deltaproteobacteria bacterium]MBW2032520.1 ribbon-helix-helix protein, CopG family [Deltaproteobacteria bacterium]MBW2357259.1 ribbon-helix-helix protein, CopG family [Deltaproteobacteria bacterium]